MSTLIKGQDVRTIAAGINVGRTAASVAAALTSIYTVSGGRIILVSLTATVTATMDATATTITVGLTPTLGAGTSKPAALATASASIASKEVGTQLGLGASVAAALTLSADASVPLLLPPRQIINAGTITYTGAVGANAGLLKWDLTYIPLDVGAAVVAA